MNLTCDNYIVIVNKVKSSKTTIYGVTENDIERLRSKLKFHKSPTDPAKLHIENGKIYINYNY